MSLLDFIGQAVKQVGQKQIQALEEFSSALDKVQVAKDYIKNAPSDEVSQNIKIENKDTSHFQGPRNEGSDYDGEVHSNTSQRNLFFFQKIANKNTRALDHFFKKLDTVQVEPMIEFTIKQATELTEEPDRKIKDSAGQSKKMQTIQSFEVQNHQLAECHKTIDVETPNRKRLHYIRSLQMYKQNDVRQNPEEMQNLPEEKQKTASQILSELHQIHRQRSIERMQKPIGRSLNKRTRIIKMGSQMQDLMREKKQKEAEQKIKVNIDFLQSIKFKPSKQQTSFKEFKNSPNQDSERLKQSIRIKTIKKTSLSRNHHDPMSQDLKFSLAKYQRVNLNDSNIFMDSRLRLPQISSKKGALKPKPYSIYNVTQRGNEMFVHV